MNGTDYLRDGRAIYERSFAIIRAEADLSRFVPDEAEVAIRMIHACGEVAAASRIVFSPGFVARARAALAAGAAVLCDAEMVSHGITRARLPANNPVICTLRDPATAAIAERIGNTRSAAAIIGMPVGFVGAAESKDALAANAMDIPFAIVSGRLGGSAMTAAAVNALARPGL